jgi:hypothetical protein
VGIEPGYRLFGIEICPEVPLPGDWTRRAAGDAALRLRLADAAELDAAWSGDAQPGWEGRLSDGERFVALRGAGGDHRFTHAGSTFHLSRDLRLLLCAPRYPSASGWRRVLLDSVLFSVALLHGREALHAAAVEIDGGAHAIVASSGGGKSALCAELVSRGHRLVTDDVLVLSPAAAGPLAHPGPPLMNLPSGHAGLLGRTIARFGEEAWTAVPVADEPLPLRSVTVLARGDFPGVEIVERAPSALAVLPHLLRFPRTPERERSRFAMACELARARLLRLEADRSAAPAELADRLEAVLESRAVCA